METTRRDALVSIAGAASIAAAHREPAAFGTRDYRLLEDVVDMIIPDSATPGARRAGVAATIDEDAAGDDELKRRLQAALSRLAADGFADMSEPARTALLSDYMTAGDERREHFQLLKDLTVDHYYATEIGLVDELGYQGNTYLAEFPGCQHEEHA